MNKEQEINELATIREMVKILEDFCHSEKCKRYDCNYCTCEVLHNAGYRKQSEVAKEMLTRLADRIASGIPITLEFIFYLAKEYGVEL